MGSRDGGGSSPSNPHDDLARHVDHGPGRVVRFSEELLEGIIGADGEPRHQDPAGLGDHEVPFGRRCLGWRALIRPRPFHCAPSGRPGLEDQARNVGRGLGPWIRTRLHAASALAGDGRVVSTAVRSAAYDVVHEPAQGEHGAEIRAAYRTLRKTMHPDS